MAAFNIGGRAVDELCEALKKRKKFVEVSSMLNFGALLDEVYRAEPRLAGCVAGYEGKSSKNGMLGLNKTYRLEIKYMENTVDDFDQIILDDGKWKPSDALAAMSDIPSVFQVVTKDVNSLDRRVSDDMTAMKERCPGMLQCGREWNLEFVNGYTTMWIKPKFAVDDGHYRMYQTLTKREMERIDSRFFGKGGNIPKLIRVFLAFSYLQQTCKYDQESADLLNSEKYDRLERPWVVIPYGALVKRMAVCEGIAFAFKLFMDYYGIPNRIVFGQVGEDGAKHCWNMVCLNEKYYHVDATYGLEGDGVYIGAFLKNDVDMSDTHFWDMSSYPACTSRKVDYDDVENYISEHMDELLRFGVEERFMCPEEIRE